MSPVGSAGALKPSQMALSHEEKLAIQNKQGWAPFGVEMTIVDDANNELPWDGKLLRPAAEGPGASRSPKSYFPRTTAARSTR